MAKFELTKTNQKDWKRNALIFVIPPAILYLTQIQTGVAQGFSLDIFIPTQFTLGGITVYITSTLIDLGRKFIQEAGK